MRRRDLISAGTALALAPTLAVILACGPSAAQSAKRFRVGYLQNIGPTPAFEAFRQSLGRLGLIEGRDIAIEARFAEGKDERLAELAAELVRLDLDAIAAVGAGAVQAARKATPRIPIVFTVAVEPRAIVALGFAATLERPGGNITGVSSSVPPVKQFEVLKEAIPNLTRVAILSESDLPNPASDPGWNPRDRANDTAARAQGLLPQFVRIKGPTPDLVAVFTAVTREQAEALVILDLPATVPHYKAIADLSVAHRIPTMFTGGQPHAGGLIDYGARFSDGIVAMVGQLDKILKGAKPGELPIETISKPLLTVNLKTARALDLSLPQSLLTRADEVIK